MKLKNEDTSMHRVNLQHESRRLLHFQKMYCSWGPVLMSDPESDLILLVYSFLLLVCSVEVRQSSLLSPAHPSIS